MNQTKDDKYYLSKVIADLRFIIAHTRGVLQEDLCEDEVLLDSVMFRLIQISENSDKLTAQFRTGHPEIPWRALKGMRNRIVHNYGGVDIGIIYNTVQIDIPETLEQLEGLV
ncbi:MAG: DUF86 domain-containing protein [Faecousia sp.]